MIAVALTPRVQMLAICDRVQQSLKEPTVYHLKGVRQHLTARAFPFRPRSLWLFTIMSYHRPGEFPCYIRIINERTARTILYSNINPTPVFDTGLSYWMDASSIRCSFPEPGRYAVELGFFQEVGYDVVKGETRLWISEPLE